jgi:hypothetical protein
MNDWLKIEDNIFECLKNEHQLTIDSKWSTSYFTIDTKSNKTYFDLILVLQHNLDLDVKRIVSSGVTILDTRGKIQEAKKL